MLSYDAVVIGGGPAGAAAANELVKKGIHPLIVEKKKLPRLKPCSGILCPESVAMVEKNFGTPPQNLFSKPGICKGLRWYFPGGLELDFPIEKKSWIIWRNHFDNWLCEQSKAEIFDLTSLKSFKEDDSGVTLCCERHGGEELKIRCKLMVAADGGYSRVVKALHPESYDSLKWYIGMQNTYQCRHNLEEGYFHYFPDPGISRYPSAMVKGGLVELTVLTEQGKKISSHMDRLIEFLIHNYGFKDYHLEQKLGFRISWATLQGKSFFGTDRILVAGEASGLLNMLGEGISSALSSGVIAGRVAARSIKEVIPAGETYKKEVEVERKKTLNQFTLAQQLLGTIGGANWRQGARRLKISDWSVLMKDMGIWTFRGGGIKKRITPN